MKMETSRLLDSNLVIEKFLIRMPKNLKHALAEAAQNNRRSLNSEIIHRLKCTSKSNVQETVLVSEVSVFSSEPLEKQKKREKILKLLEILLED